MKGLLRDNVNTFNTGIDFVRKPTNCRRVWCQRTPNSLWITTVCKWKFGRGRSVTERHEDSGTFSQFSFTERCCRSLEGGESTSFPSKDLWSANIPTRHWRSLYIRRASTPKQRRSHLRPIKSDSSAGCSYHCENCPWRRKKKTEEVKEFGSCAENKVKEEKGETKELSSLFPPQMTRIK